MPRVNYQPIPAVLLSTTINKIQLGTHIYMTLKSGLVRRDMPWVALPGLTIHTSEWSDRTRPLRLISYQSMGLPIVRPNKTWSSPIMCLTIVASQHSPQLKLVLPLLSCCELAYAFGIMMVHLPRCFVCSKRQS